MRTARRWRLVLCLGLALLSGISGHAQQPTAPLRLAFVYPGGETNGPAEFLRAVQVPGVSVTAFAPGAEGTPLAEATDFTSFDVVFVDGRTEGLARHAAQFAAARARTKVVVVPAGGDVDGNVDLAAHPWLAQYWANQSQDNYAAIARYLVTRVAARTLDLPAAPAPIVYPAQGFYHPDAPGLFGTIEQYLAWYRTRTGAGAHRYDPAALTVGAYVYITTYQQKHHQHVDAVMRAVEHRGHNAVAMVFRSNPVLTAFASRGASVVDALIYVGSSLSLRDREASIADARQLGVPILGAFHHSGLTPEAFRASPTGLHPALTTAVVDSERDGRFEPIVISGRGGPLGDRYYTEVFQAQVEWRVDRALAWAALRRLPNARKRVVFTYWSEGGGKANIGGDPDDFLDVQGTLTRLLPRMRAQGYDLGPGHLPDRDTLSKRMALSASNVGNWAPGELAARVASGAMRLVPEATYSRWFSALPAERRAEIVDMWGPPPGNVMVHTDAHGKRFLVIPVVEYGNVLLAPHPDWGQQQNNKALMAVKALPPHHQYLAFFLWLRQEWKANAWVSLFSNSSLQMGKSEGPAADDHISLMLGALPHIHPERLGSNGSPGNKRKTMALTVGWYNLVGASDTAETTFDLRAALARYAALADAEVRGAAEPIIRAEVEKAGLTRLIDGDVATLPMDALVTQVRARLNEIDRAMAPAGSKVLGEAPTGKTLADMVTAMIGLDLRTALAPLVPEPFVSARRLVGQILEQGRSPHDALMAESGRSSPDAERQLALATDYADRLRTAPRETDALFEVLEGRWIDPGPMDEPIRKPDALPPGRSIYNFDQAAIPTPEAEALGRTQAEALIAAHRAQHGGAYPTKLAFVIFSSAIARNHGVVEAQALHLLGARPVRDVRGAVTGVELIPRAELGRPRVDVLLTTSGTYRDHYQDKVDLIAEAARLAAESPEPDNPVAASTRTTETALRAKGETPERAAALARARVFSPAPGSYSPNIQFLAKSGDQRGDQARMAELYTSRLSHAYGAGLYGESGRATFEQQVSRIDAATLQRDSNVNGMLDHPMSAGFLGGLNLAAKAITGKDVDLYVSNLRDAERPVIEPAARTLQTELRTRYFNKGWLQDMQAHGYDGARNMMMLTDHLDLWDSTASGMVQSADWAEVKDVYVDDTLGLDMQQFFARHNPHAKQALLANLIGAADRGYWDASAEDLADVATQLAASMREHGAVCQASVCRNPALTALVGQALGNVPGGAELLEGYRAAIARATTPAPAVSAMSAAAAGTAPGGGPAPTATAPAAPPPAPTITGRALEERRYATVTAGRPTAMASTRLAALVGLSLVLLATGWARRYY